ncbi:cupin domain-containing protein [Ornithinimicrobium faecis]|uniref:Cupin domain-containing protein n=1 Tax=Ornithinimicrobium faecis TaxID=2934158 RepID=A0ABY4YQ85_9MICO|nr:MULTISPECIES: cupin domain-containing protein [unclassified Ornithinimicrobium]USQ78660.1 cupin domain-containing protein [Ornithinimicrobium sp. HY1793]
MRETVELAEGAALVMKRMVGTDGTAFPAHTASLESALVIVEGSCSITFADAVHELGVGDTFVVPAGEVHHVAGTPDFAAVHVMPRDIRFNFIV